MRIGIFGGAFNPVHNGHMSLAESYFTSLRLDKLIFIPTACPPHKSAQQLAAGQDRVNMLSLAINGRKGFEISTVEFEREGKSYTYDTLLALKKSYPDAVFFLIIGADQLFSFHLWYRYKDILDMVTLCTAARDDEAQRAQMLSYAESLDGLDMSRFYLSQAEVVKVSSTQLRDRIRNGESISQLVPGAVEKYISETRLYNIMYNTEELKAVIRERLSDYRYYHSVCVADSAKALAKRYGADVHKAEVAGILHDATKECKKKEQLEYISRAGMEISDFEKKGKKFYHQISGAAFAKTELGIEDEEILSAIRYHTTGKGNMTLLQEIVYLADFISADRDYDDIENIRAEAEKGKEYGLLYATQYTIKSVVEEGKPLHPDTVEAYNWMLSKYFSKKG